MLKFSQLKKYSNYKENALLFNCLDIKNKIYFTKGLFFFFFSGLSWSQTPAMNFLKLIVHVYNNFKKPTFGQLDTVMSQV